jgi:CheY-like chemotaxis protein
MPQRIFIVEDDPFTTRLLEDVLTSVGYDVSTADSALGAAVLVCELAPCAILFDIGLPLRPGTELLDQLKADKRTRRCRS